MCAFVTLNKKITYLLTYTVTLRWDGMGWAALVTRCISVDAFTHKLCCDVLCGAGITLLVFYRRASTSKLEPIIDQYKLI